ncbi:MAG TPA: energy transducer TonB [Rhodanobacteraceae bacterium]|nr:energy transducer TonB [Rhodanobacteraceae bacterium]
MTTAKRMHGHSLNWLRISAWSGSFTAHIVILLLVLLPLTVPATREQATTIVARTIEQTSPPVFPEPPPPQIPHRAHTTPVRAVPPTIPLVQSSGSIAATVALTDPAPVDDASSPSADIGSGGASQILAYASPLHPRYPPASMRAHEQGIVMLRVLVDETGFPERVEIARSSGHALLDAAAEESVRHARFRPVMRNGRAISAWGTVPIEFRLDRG